MRLIIDSAQRHFSLFGIRGVLGRALTAVPGVGREFRVPIPGHSHKVLIRLGTTDVAAFEHVFVDEEYGFNLATPPAVIIDAGANAGMSAVYFALRYPGARIIAIEPEPTNYEILRKNVALFPQIIPLNAALWNRDATVQIQDFGGGHWAKRVADGGQIRSISMRSLLREYGINRVDLLKVDVEGAECEIFEDHEQWIGRVDSICVELHDRFRVGCSEIFEVATVEFSNRWQRGELHCVSRYAA